jgi:hypothetical protein
MGSDLMDLALVGECHTLTSVRILCHGIGSQPTHAVHLMPVLISFEACTDKEFFRNANDEKYFGHSDKNLFRAHGTWDNKSRQLMPGTS